MTREMFPRDTGIVFDPLGPADSAVALTLNVLLDPARAARLVANYAGDPATPGFDELTVALLNSTWFASPRSGIDAEIQRLTNHQVLLQLLMLAADAEADPQVRAIAFDAVSELDNWLEGRGRNASDASWRAHYRMARYDIERVRRDPAILETIVPVEPPPGSPVGGFAQ